MIWALPASCTLESLRSMPAVYVTVRNVGKSSFLSCISRELDNLDQAIPASLTTATPATGSKSDANTRSDHVAVAPSSWCQEGSRASEQVETHRVRPPTSSRGSRALSESALSKRLFTIPSHVCILGEITTWGDFLRATQSAYSQNNVLFFDDQKKTKEKKQSQGRYRAKAAFQSDA